MQTTLSFLEAVSSSPFLLPEKILSQNPRSTIPDLPLPLFCTLMTGVSAEYR